MKPIFVGLSGDAKSWEAMPAPTAATAAGLFSYSRVLCEPRRPLKAEAVTVPRQTADPLASVEATIIITLYIGQIVLYMKLDVRECGPHDLKHVSQSLPSLETLR